MKSVLEEAIEQIKGQPKKSQAKPTQGLAKQLDPGKTVSEALKQSLGFSGEKKVPSQEELSQMKEEEKKKVEAEINQVSKDLGQEEAKKPKPKGNVNLIYPPPKPTEREETEQKQKTSLPPLAEPTLKPRRGSWTEYIERKTKGAEIKGGRE